MPSPQNSTLWVERTPPDLTFNIKAFRLFTGHQTAPSALPEDVAETLGPLERKNVYYKDMPAEQWVGTAGSRDRKTVFGMALPASAETKVGSAPRLRSFELLRYHLAE